MRQMTVIGEDPRRAINDYSQQFQRDFLQLLKTSHGEKRIHINRFYQEFISDKLHSHLNSTRWSSLTEFGHYLGREGICRVEEEEGDEGGRGGGVFISWIDNSPEALRRQNALRKKERQDRGDEEREQKTIEEQIERARTDKGTTEEDELEEDTRRELQRKEGEKIKLSFGAKPVAKPPSPPLTDRSDEEKERKRTDTSGSPSEPTDTLPAPNPSTESTSTKPSPPSENTPEPSKPAFKFGSTNPNKPKNIFAAAGKKSNPLAGPKKTAAPAQQRPMSEAERIMKEEIERKRMREERKGFAPGLNGTKRQRVS